MLLNPKIHAIVSFSDVGKSMGGQPSQCDEIKSTLATILRHECRRIAHHARGV
jgi:hypothetical protein